jgi:curli biogenesis system outer membrane secretion channel CsgG
MMSFSRFLRLVILTIALAPLSSSGLAQTTTPKRRIAVMNFDYHAVDSDTLGSIFGGDQDVGRGVSALLIAKLVLGGDYTVIEYAALDKVLAEQDFSKAERADPLVASRVGRILGVDAILLGSITRFGPEHEPKKTAGKRGAFAPMTGGAGASTNKSKASVEITVRIVNPMTGEVIASVIGTGLSAEAGTFYYASLHTKQGDFDFSSRQFAGTVLGEAAHNAVDAAAAQLLALADKIPFAKYQVRGLIADVSGKELILNVGSRDGLKIGDTLQVRHQVRVILVPLPGASIREVTEDVGSATITALEPGSASAIFSGTGPIAVGDSVRTFP